MISYSPPERTAPEYEWGDFIVLGSLETIDGMSVCALVAL